MAKPNPDPGVTVTKLARPWTDPSPTGAPFKPQPRPRLAPFAVLPERPVTDLPKGREAWTLWQWKGGEFSGWQHHRGPCRIEVPHAAISATIHIGPEKPIDPAPARAKPKQHRKRKGAPQ